MNHTKLKCPITSSLKQIGPIFCELLLLVEKSNKHWRDGFRNALKNCTAGAHDAFPENRYLENVKVKMSLCLTKHHVMKKYWGSGRIAPCILFLGTRWRWVVKLHAPAVSPQRKSPTFPLHRRLEARFKTLWRNEIHIDLKIDADALYRRRLRSPLRRTIRHI